MMAVAPGSDVMEHVHTDWFAEWARYAPDAVAIEEFESGRRFTYAASHAIIRRTAALLRDAYGVRAGDRVAILSTNDAEYVFLFFAVMRIGAMLVPVNYRLAPREVQHVLGDCAPRLLVHAVQFADTVAALDAVPGMAHAAWDGEAGFAARMHDETLPLDEAAADAGFATPVMILYTSGTTGAPKGAIITHGMLFWNSINTGLRLNLVQHDVTLTFAPFFHTGGWNVLTTPFLHRGARIILMRKFDADAVLELCDSAGVTILFGVPTMMDMMHRSERFARASLASVRYAIVGGEPMPAPLIRAWQEKGVPIRQGYGLTEFGPNVYSLNEEDAIRKIGSIGFPNFYIDARVVRDDGSECGTDEVGELVLRGPVCTPGYWNNPDATAAAIRDGWFHTGDLVRRDADGYTYVVDRKKDMFISGAENVYPAEIEHLLRTHPAVDQVAVVGVPDATWGEVGRAFVVLRAGAAATEAELLEFCRGQLARYKIPKSVRFLDALPVSDSGKILKRALRDASLEDAS